MSKISIVSTVAARLSGPGTAAVHTCLQVFTKSSHKNIITPCRKAQEECRPLPLFFCCECINLQKRLRKKPLFTSCRKSSPAANEYGGYPNDSRRVFILSVPQALRSTKWNCISFSAAKQAFLCGCAPQLLSPPTPRWKAAHRTTVLQSLRGSSYQWRAFSSSWGV